MKSGRHYRRLKTAHKCYKINKTEVSLSEKTSVRTHLLKHVKNNLLGHGITPDRAPSKTKLIQSLNQDKVRLNQIVDHLKPVKKNRVLTHPVISGSKMSKDGADKPDKNDDEKKRRKMSKDRNKRLGAQKSIKAKPSKHWEVDPEALRHEIDKANKTLKNREGKRHPSQKEIRKHLHAISQSVTQLAALRGQKKKPSIPHSATEGSSSHDTNRATKPVVNKRKRNDSKVKSEPESDSAETQGRPNKRSRRSTVSETDETTDDEESETSGSEEEPETKPQKVPETMAPTESDILKGRAGKGSDEKRLRLAQRSNDLFDHNGVNKEGKNYYRRKPPKDGGIPFKPPPDKPSDGAKLKSFPKGKMLKAAKIAERQTAGKG